ncbi:hypothetical protein JQ631_26825 [Bradyrhizobium manausense]|uniref:hypothetical protein n=1 Tax=Bradyrhizobium manausense TaxID=989370 RepID=UPI001BAA28CE|nr:hypothetical protein [Bradyrhizobium manausense]MBR0792704.1 hypothetical protein [Bradyrhizobium manausense]
MTGYLTQSLSKAAAGDISYIVGLGLLIYAVMLPPMLVAGHSFQPVPEPRGTKVEISTADAATFRASFSNPAHGPSTTIIKDKPAASPEGDCPVPPNLAPPLSR